MNFNFKNVFDGMTADQIAQYEKEIDEKINAYEQAEKINRYKKSGVPERYFTESLESYKTENELQKKVKQMATTYLHEILDGKFKSFVMVGNAGTGKTHIACALVREAGGKYRSAPDLVEEFRRVKSFTANETEAQKVKYYGNLSFLVIDEIGRGINEQEEKYMLYQLLNARYNTRKPTVLISNHNKADFLRYIGVAAADRLVESADIIEMNGASYRLNLRGN